MVKKYKTQQINYSNSNYGVCLFIIINMFFSILLALSKYRFSWSNTK